MVVVASLSDDETVRFTATEGGEGALAGSACGTGICGNVGVG